MWLQGPNLVKTIKLVKRRGFNAPSCVINQQTPVAFSEVSEGLSPLPMGMLNDIVLPYYFIWISLPINDVEPPQNLMKRDFSMASSRQNLDLFSTNL